MVTKKFMFSFFQQATPEKTYLPDSLYSVCGEETQACGVCKNEVWSPVVNSYVHDTQAGKVFCPFGKGDSMNTPIFQDQAYLNRLNNQPQTTWGHVPQLGPRSLVRVGLEFRTN